MADSMDRIDMQDIERIQQERAGVAETPMGDQEARYARILSELAQLNQIADEIRATAHKVREKMVGFEPQVEREKTHQKEPSRQLDHQYLHLIKMTRLTLFEALDDSQAVLHELP